jgi:hypothetical protein
MYVSGLKTPILCLLNRAEADAAGWHHLQLIPSADDDARDNGKKKIFGEGTDDREVRILLFGNATIIDP